ncbi:hypothetical protein QLX52_30555 [Streptomyces albus]|uniref:hypothetical protein n=1 Tax=Streptomyces albus TaxID=1888 RepID=UPI0024ACEC02|nr:hypothetical protein [Streptomyces albus]MDI6413151.1 hypothetical protein [Streptomyces albus]
MDVTVGQWAQRLENGVAETVARRRTAVRRKPRPAVAPAVSQIAARKQAPADDEPGDGRPLWRLRKEQWAATASAVRDADTRRAQLPEGDAPSEGPALPLEPVRITA